ncbi:hypothetical protein [Imhoffiella purpurea]|uniref:hypothetical protein n=1 Tax=Imhoffiella purpurea TaxID=1249627 RepID=UPI0012FE1E7A|nr:hypothetical protein [Imhoffiella purpurea]
MSIEKTDKREIVYYKDHRISVYNLTKKDDLWYFEVKITTPVDAPAVRRQFQNGECACSSADEAIKFGVQSAMKYIDENML